MVCSSVENLRDLDAVTKALRTSLASKQYGYEDFLSKLIAQACGNFIIVFDILFLTLVFVGENFFYLGCFIFGNVW